ncbi:MAG: hypothetical protein PHS80_04730 [Methanothrix sp.]|nr:hypothetical protein [Methanothrix sp.]MDD4446714.1 hypothetical protein [Methanothrix sp.]
MKRGKTCEGDVVVVPFPSPNYIRGQNLAELALLNAREQLTLSEIKDMEQKYGMTSSEFWNKFESGVLGDDQDYFVWWSLIRGLEAVRARKDS